MCENSAIWALEPRQKRCHAAAMGENMTEQTALRGISIDWAEVSEDSYLHEIPVIRLIEHS